MLKAARFDSKTLLELKEDQTATGQAFAVLFMVGLSYGVGFPFVSGIGMGSVSIAFFLLNVLTGLIQFMLTMLLWSMLAFVIGTRFFRGVTSFTGLLRPLYFSTAPGLLFALMVIPVLTVGQAILALAWGWIIVAGVFAVKNAMGFSIYLSMLTFIIYIFVFVLLGGFLLSLL